VNDSQPVMALVFGIGAPIVIARILITHSSLVDRPNTLWFAAVGAAIAFLAMFVERWVIPATIPGTAAAAIGVSVGLIAPIEEIAKFSVIHHESKVRPDSNGRRLALTGMAIGSGFAAFENALYVVGTGRASDAVAATRLMTATPFHMANGAIAGMLAHWAFKLGSPLATLWALTVIIALHGAYDAPLFMGGETATKYAFVLGLTVAVAIAAYRRLGRTS